MLVGRDHHDVVVMDLGGTKIRLGYLRDGIPNNDHEIISSGTLRVAGAYKILAQTIKHFASSRKLNLQAAVLGLPGMLNRDEDVFSHCNNIPQLEGKGLQAFLTCELDCTVILEQDIMLQLLGEWRNGEAVASPSVFGVYFGTGIGAAYLVDGNPYNYGAAGLQAGHIPVMAEGKPCICGNTDCIEAYACGHTLIELSDRFECPVEQLFTIKTKPELACALERFVMYQSFMLSTLITLFVPDTILVGGGIPLMKAYPHEALIENVHKHLQKPYPADVVKIKWASLGSQASLYGALALIDMHKLKPKHQTEI